MRHISIIHLCVCGILFCIGCRQAEGDRCQLDDDCSSELICCVDVSDQAAVIAGGTCQLQDKCELVRSDAGADGGPADLAARDTTSDTSDMSAIDAARDTTASDGLTEDGQPDGSIDGISSDSSASDGTALDATDT